MTESLITLIGVVALLLGSPGPAPLALAAVGASFGVRRGIPFLLGVLGGLCVAIVGVVIALSTLFTIYPAAQMAVQILGGCYILYVAYKIATAPVIQDNGTAQSIPSFVHGFILNLLNPKAYAAFFAIFSQFSLPLQSNALSLLVTGVICILVATVVDAAWLMLGGVIRPLFRNPLQARILRITFAVIMVLAVAYAFVNAAN